MEILDQAVAGKDQRSAFDFKQRITAAGLDLKPGVLETLQINITRLCNQACIHCHVDASPRRREMASPAVLEAVLQVLEKSSSLQTLDITGGAPELHPQFRELVQKARRLGKRVIVRHNLTVTLDPHPLTGESLLDLPEFFASQQVEVVSSLPCYQEETTDQQRGKGVFDKSIASLRMLNERGFGREGSGLLLKLVYNPVGAFLPGSQANLEQVFKRELASRYQLSFNQLLVITNMPIHRFKAQLKRSGAYEEYMHQLVQAFNPVAARGLMCRSMLSVSETGGLYDCDFNQMLGIACQGPQRDIFTFAGELMQEREIAVAEHCFGCAAGSGSSCAGALTS